MATMKLILPDGQSLDVPDQSPYREAVRSIGEGLLRNALAVNLDGVNFTLDDLVTSGGRFEVITRGSEAGDETLRHSTAHLLAWAVQESFPGVKFAFGPAIENGFYYDFDRDEPFCEDDLAVIEAKMHELARQHVPVTRQEVSPSTARELFGAQPYKLDQIATLEDEKLSLYNMGGFTDLCEGPHVPDTSVLKHFKLLSVAGAYWRGDNSQPMLQRIYGTAFFKRKDLESHLVRLEEARKRDHRKLGRELDLFSIMEEAGPGLSFWHPRGDILREQVMSYWQDLHRRRGYVTVTTPHISNAELWETSGHMQFYRDHMYVFEQDGKPYVVKPMNCPGHILIYKRKVRSYRHLPVRYAELGTVYRYELPGTLNGLKRVRGFTQDDAHIFCSPEQLEDEVKGVLDLTKELMHDFGFQEFKVDLSVRDPEHREKYAGSDEEWEAAELSLVRALDQHDLSYSRVEGEAVFYGPKIDVKLIDAIGRPWQTTTVQFDFNLPHRFDVTYTDREGRECYVYMVHRAIMGSLERFIGILTEHYAGDFPLWLAPEQCRVLSVSRDQHGYARQVTQQLREAGLRVNEDVRDEKIGFKIREAELMKIPYMLIVGRQEADSGQVAVRARKRGDLGTQLVTILAQELLDEIANKK